MTEKDIQRINELYHKKIEGTITPEELEEQARLRKEYILAIRRNLGGSLDTMKIQYPDGTVVDLKKRHDEKYGKRTH